MTREEFEALLDIAAEQLGKEVRESDKYHDPRRFQQRVLEVLSAVARDKGIEVNPAFHPHAFPDILANGFGVEVKEFDGGHKKVKHGKGQYVRGKNHEIHVNAAESYFALLKRGVHGTFHHVSKKHLARYCDEFSFRWGQRKVTDGERAVVAIKGADGKRLLYQKGEVT